MRLFPLAYINVAMFFHLKRFSLAYFSRVARENTALHLLKSYKIYRLISLSLNKILTRDAVKNGVFIMEFQKREIGKFFFFRFGRINRVIDREHNKLTQQLSSHKGETKERDLENKSSSWKKKTSIDFRFVSFIRATNFSQSIK